jgi:hypothetical protein
VVIMSKAHETALRLPRLQGATLARLVLCFVACAAVAGWAASFVGLHGFALAQMHGYTVLTAWLVPGSFDGAAFACSVLVYRASIFGRSAMRGRVLMYLFTALSGWINWHFQVDPLGQWVASALPFAAVLVFDTVLSDLRAEWETSHGQQAFRLRLGLLWLRWLVDRRGTWSAFRATLIAVPVTDLVGLGNLAPGGTGTTVVPVPPTLPEHRAAPDVPVPAVPVVTQPQPAPRHPVPPARPTPTTAVPRRPVPPESAAETTMVMAPISMTAVGAKVAPVPGDRSKVSPAATSRHLVTVPDVPLATLSDDELVSMARTWDQVSRRRVMAEFGIGSGRAAKITSIVKGA